MMSSRRACLVAWPHNAVTTSGAAASNGDDIRSYCASTDERRLNGQNSEVAVSPSRWVCGCSTSAASFLSSRPEFIEERLEPFFLLFSKSSALYGVGATRRGQFSRREDFWKHLVVL